MQARQLNLFVLLMISLLVRLDTKFNTTLSISLLQIITIAVCPIVDVEVEERAIIS
jgi:hypothetical protein